MFYPPITCLHTSFDVCVFIWSEFSAPFLYSTALPGTFFPSNLTAAMVAVMGLHNLILRHISVRAASSITVAPAL